MSNIEFGYPDEGITDPNNPAYVNPADAWQGDIMGFLDTLKSYWDSLTGWTASVGPSIGNIGAWLELNYIFIVTIIAGIAVIMFGVNMGGKMAVYLGILGLGIVGGGIGWWSSIEAKRKKSYESAIAAGGWPNYGWDKGVTTTTRPNSATYKGIWMYAPLTKKFWGGDLLWMTKNGGWTDLVPI